MNNFTFYSPTKVIFGKGVETSVGAEIKAWGGTKIMVHFGGGSVKKTGLLDRVEASLKDAGLSYLMFGGAQPNPRLKLVHEGIELARKEGVDFILCVGGGSAIDSGKSIALGVPYDGDVWDFYDEKVEPKASLPVACILTLAAAGSETSKSSVITKEEGWLKKGYGTEFNRPKFAMMNPELTYTLPPYQTACGIVDIMMHTLDRYLCNSGTNEMTDRIAEQVLKTVSEFGAIAMKEPENYLARSEVMWAGSLSHNDLTGLGLKGDWAPHQLEHELGGMFDVAHGAGLAAVWGAWAKYVYKEGVLRFARLGVNVWGLSMDYENPERTALDAIQRTMDYFASIDMPVTTTQLLGRELTDAEIEELAEKCTFFGRRTIGGMKVLDKQDMIEIYKASR